MIALARDLPAQAKDLMLRALVGRHSIAHEQGELWRIPTGDGILQRLM